MFVFVRVEGVPVYRCLYADWNDLIRGKIGGSGVRRVAGMVFLWVRTEKGLAMQIMHK